jgi:hypothetical protein
MKTPALKFDTATADHLEIGDSEISELLMQVHVRISNIG